MKNIAIIGAGMSGIVAARTLTQAGHHVEVFEKSQGVGGRMSTRETTFGNFDHGAQYFTVRDARFKKALDEVAGTAQVHKAWSANAVRVLDPLGRVIEAPLPHRESHFVGSPGMNALVRHWAQPLQSANQLHTSTLITQIVRHANHQKKWQVIADIDLKLKQTSFDHVILAMPHVQTAQLLRQSGSNAVGFSGLALLDRVTVAPCWTLMLAYPNASQPGLSHLGPQWNAARSTHHRIAWLSRESSKPNRKSIERWTVQASAQWSTEHLEDDEMRVRAKLIKAFAELTGIRAEPAYAQAHRWRYAKTLQPLGQNFLWDEKLSIGTCGDWHIGHRVEDAFISGLSLALHLS
ncbi:MAG: NAD(P)/FAD-dependent oxidoreductase [Burkholderiaceae bacterium]